MNYEDALKRKVRKGVTVFLFVLAAATVWIAKSLAELFGKIFDFLEPYKNDLKHSVTGKTYQPEEVCEVTPEEPPVERPLDDGKPQDN